MVQNRCVIEARLECAYNRCDTSVDAPYLPKSGYLGCENRTAMKPTWDCSLEPGARSIPCNRVPHKSLFVRLAARTSKYLTKGGESITITCMGFDLEIIRNTTNFPVTRLVLEFTGKPNQQRRLTKVLPVISPPRPSPNFFFKNDRKGWAKRRLYSVQALSEMPSQTISL